MSDASSPKRNNLLGLLLIGWIVAVAATGFGVWWLYSVVSAPFSSAERDLPAELKEPRVLKGADFLARTEFFKHKKLSLLETIFEAVKIGDDNQRQQKINTETSKAFFSFSRISVGEHDGEAGLDVLLIGRAGIQFLDTNGNLKKESFFNPKAKKVKIAGFETQHAGQNFSKFEVIDLENDGKSEFLAWGIVDGAILFDHEGQEVWRVGGSEVDLGNLWDEKKREASAKEPHVRGATAGDLNGDGTKEILVTLIYDGIRAFDSKGNLLWHQADEFPGDKIAVLDFDGDGKNEIVEFDSRVKIRNLQGELVREFTATPDGDYFVFAEKDGKSKQLQFFDLDKNRFILNVSEGKELFNADAPLSDVKLENPHKVDVPTHPELSYTRDSETAYKPQAVWVRLTPNQPKVLAMAAHFIGKNRAVFYVYSDKGELLYHELLPEEAETITALPQENGRDAILVGGQQTVWRYNAK